VRCNRLKAKCASLEQQLKRHECAKTYDGRVTEEWIQRIICCSPHTSGRALADTLGFAIGSDKSVLSRWSIARVKAAWVKMYTNMVEAATGAWVKSVRAATGAGGGQFIAVFVTHVQDEADIRILPGHARDGPQIPRRQRASKVQSHVMEIVCKGRCIKIPTELEALGDKKKHQRWPRCLKGCCV